MKNILKEYILFLRHPELLKPDVLSLKQSVKLIRDCLGIYLIVLLIFIVLVILMSFISEIPELPKRKRSELYLVIFFAPLVEELIFRLPLRNFFKNIFVVIGLSIYGIMKIYIDISLAIFIGIIIMALPYIPNLFEALEVKVNIFTKKFYTYIFYLFGLSFGLLHISNIISLTSGMYMIAAIYIFKVIIIGLLFAFIRVKYRFGIIYAIVLHSLTNLIHVFPSLF